MAHPCSGVSFPLLLSPKKPQKQEIVSSGTELTRAKRKQAIQKRLNDCQQVRIVYSTCYIFFNHARQTTSVNQGRFKRGVESSFWAIIQESPGRHKMAFFAGPPSHTPQAALRGSGTFGTSHMELSGSPLSERKKQRPEAVNCVTSERNGAERLQTYKGWQPEGARGFVV